MLKGGTKNFHYTSVINKGGQLDKLKEIMAKNPDAKEGITIILGNKTDWKADDKGVLAKNSKGSMIRASTRAMELEEAFTFNDGTGCICEAAVKGEVFRTTPGKEVEENIQAQAQVEIKKGQDDVNLAVEFQTLVAYLPNPSPKSSTPFGGEINTILLVINKETGKLKRAVTKKGNSYIHAFSVKLPVDVARSKGVKEPIILDGTNLAKQAESQNPEEFKAVAKEYISGRRNPYSAGASALFNSDMASKLGLTQQQIEEEQTKLLSEFIDASTVGKIFNWVKETKPQMFEDVVKDTVYRGYKTGGVLKYKLKVKSK